MALSLPCHAFHSSIPLHTRLIIIYLLSRFFPAMSITAHWFTTKLPYAMGFVAAGASVGGIVFPLMLSRLIPKIGFGVSSSCICTRNNCIHCLCRMDCPCPRLHSILVFLHRLLYYPFSSSQKSISSNLLACRLCGVQGSIIYTPRYGQLALHILHIQSIFLRWTLWLGH